MYVGNPGLYWFQLLHTPSDVCLDLLGTFVADDGVYAVQENGYEKSNTRGYGHGSLAWGIC